MSQICRSPSGPPTQIDEKDIPPHDIILAGFSCQAFSIAGKRRGFEDTRGTLFSLMWQELLNTTQPKAYLFGECKRV